MTAAEDSGAITILIFRNLKQITIEKSLGVGKKHTASRDVLYLFLLPRYCYHMSYVRPSFQFLQCVGNGIHK